jgi:redox-sensitive bicupin YhaK (pirin superfamily)
MSPVGPPPRGPGEGLDDLAYRAWVSNLETLPVETPCHAGPTAGEVEIVEPRLVPLGGPRAMTVRRTLPSRPRSLVGPWCFADHYGPDDVARRAGMNVPPHPHTGLQTVTWLFAGDVEHRDSLGTVQTIHPGQLNLMTAGYGIAHSEVSLPGTRVLHGVQLWVALPDAVRHGAPAFEHHEALPVVDLDGGARAVVVMGEYGGVASPATTFTPLVAVELTLPGPVRARLPLERGFEHGVLVDEGEVAVAGVPTAPSALAYLPPGRGEVEIDVAPGSGARVVLLGGEPFGEDILMWWNFVGRTHDEVVEARAQWQAGLAAGGPRFGRVAGYDGPPLPAPELPNVRLVPRSQR